ncbi:LysR family transcriptional regulator [Brachybacterium sp. AOP43-C2-M15]|uniref:LysR family transcriptional regulator n=1 Tax=Brachybacterium sp. AOP43-C2-M15 TaxID=3457661 RepID=UPI00403339D9
MDVRHLELLREFAVRGSVTAVARATHRTPSAVSQQLRTAQRELGVELVRPHGRGLRLTEAGELLARGGEDVAAAIAQVQDSLTGLLGSPAGSVDLLAFPSAATILFPGLAQHLDRAGIDLVLHDEDAAESRFADLTADHDVVVAHSLTGPVPEGSERCTVVPLGAEPLDVAMARTHPLAAREHLDARDLAGQSWIGVPEGFPFDRVLQAISVATGTSMRITQRLRDNRLVEAMVAGGEHLAILPRFTTAADGGVVLRPVAGVPTLRHLSALMRPDAAQRSAVRHVVRALRETAARAGLEQ